MIRKASSMAVASRAIATSLAILFTTASCEQTAPITPESLREDRPSVAYLVLIDETFVALAGPHLDANDVIHGDVMSCRGVACDAVEREGGVGLDRVAKITAKAHKSRRTAAWAAGAVLMVGATVALGYGIAQATKGGGGHEGGDGGGTTWRMSCPRVYSWSGAGWELDSGTYGGSLFAAGQLTDHDLLEHLAPESGALRLRLLNELPETEHTDSISLRVVDHPAGTRVVPSSLGKLLTFRDPAAPLVATDLRGASALDAVSGRDGREWVSNVSGRTPEHPADARDGLLLEFAKPRGARRAKLWVTARNTPWASDMLLYLLSQLGPALPAWYETMSRDAAAREAFAAFLEKEGALTVAVRTPGAWARRGVVAVAGPEIAKDQALEIPVGDVPGDRLTVRLDAPVAFWSVDAVSVAFEDDEPIEVHDLSPVTAIADDGRSVTREIGAIDGAYYETVRGNRAEISFEAPAGPGAGRSRSYVLVSTGYYVPEVVPDPRADPAEFVRLTADPEAASRLALAMLNAAQARRSLR